MKKLLWLISICCFLPTVTGMPSQASNLDVSITKAESSKAVSEFLDISSTPNTASAIAVESFSSSTVVDAPLDIVPSSVSTPSSPVKKIASNNLPQPGSGSDKNSGLLAEGCNCGFDDNISDLDSQLGNIKPPAAPGNYYSPALSINNPVGFGADNGLLFLSGDYQSRTRFTQTSDGELGIGIGLGDAVNAVGVELSYTINSFGTSQGFGSGGFNAKLHKRIADDTALAIGWNRFANIQFGNAPTDYPKNSYYAVATQVVRTTENIDDVFSRIALSAGVGGGQFLSFDRNRASLDRGGVNAFGSAAIRLAKPVSAIVEWTGQDLAAGLSIVPFSDFPLIITPAFRDISGINGESARFVLGVSTGIKF